ncbi:hypothetical protein C8J57DRAFT_1607559 [Mycena rebaudengoi]|nr:hypothetical protein C8J57DRAFT_1607559 [Mycena rebaudengoi]
MARIQLQRGHWNTEYERARPRRRNTRARYTSATSKADERHHIDINGRKGVCTGSEVGHKRYVWRRQRRHGIRATSGYARSAGSGVRIRTNSDASSNAGSSTREPARPREGIQACITEKRREGNAGLASKGYVREATSKGYVRETGGGRARPRGVYERGYARCDKRKEKGVREGKAIMNKGARKACWASTVRKKGARGSARAQSSIGQVWRRMISGHASMTSGTKGGMRAIPLERWHAGGTTRKTACAHEVRTATSERRHSHEGSTTKKMAQRALLRKEARVRTERAE